MATSIQFRGKKQVLQMFEERDINTWGIWQGKQFIHKGEGSELLESFLSLIETNAGTTQYTLKVFDDLQVKQVKEDTKADGSFNFVFDTEFDPYDRFAYSNRKNQLLERVETLEELIAKKDEQLNEEKESKLGAIGEILNNPTLQPYVQTVLNSLLSKFITPQPPQPNNPQYYQHQYTPAAMGNITTDNALMNALNVLLQLDDKFTEHMTKIAYIAQNDKQNWEIIKATLDNYPMP